MLGAVRCIPRSPKLQQPLGMGAAVLHSLHCPGVRIRAMRSPSAPLSRPHPDCRSWTRCSPSSASSLARSRLAVGGLIPRPLARSHPGLCRGQDLLRPVTGRTCCLCRRCCQVPVLEVCPLPFPPCTACGDPCFCRQGGCHRNRVHGECCCSMPRGRMLRTHVCTSRLHRAPMGMMGTPRIRDGPGCRGQWDQSTPSSFRGS